MARTSTRPSTTAPTPTDATLARAASSEDAGDLRDGPPRWADDGGMATAEYAVATLAAVGFAGLLYAVLRSGEVQEMLLSLVRSALGTP